MKKHQINSPRKISATLMVFLIIASTTTAIVYAGSGQVTEEGQSLGEGKIPEVPGCPEDAVQYNKPDVTPVAQMEQVAAGEPTLFAYRNMTMLMNCSRNCEVIFTADPEVTPKVFGLTIDPNQTMTLTMNLYGSPLQGERVMERTLNFYLGIEPNAELKLTAQIRLHINEEELEQELNREIDASKLTWMYWNKTKAQWETVNSYMDQNGYLFCNTDHFSTWTVAEVDAVTEPTPKPTENNITLEYVIGGIVIAVAIIVVAIVAYKKSK